jgi:hypothetical protein
LQHQLVADESSRPASMQCDGLRAGWRGQGSLESARKLVSCDLRGFPRG